MLCGTRNFYTHTDIIDFILPISLDNIVMKSNRYCTVNKSLFKFLSNFQKISRKTRRVKH